MDELFHLGLTVRNIDQSVAFYTEVVHMELEARRREKLMGEWYDTITRTNGARVASAHLRLDGFLLQLLEYHSEARPPLAPHHGAAGTPHLSFYVPAAELDVRHAAVVESGRHDPTPIVQLGDSDRRSFYVTDPDGIPVEFVSN